WFRFQLLKQSDSAIWSINCRNRAAQRFVSALLRLAVVCRKQVYWRNYNNRNKDRKKRRKDSVLSTSIKVSLAPSLKKKAVRFTPTVRFPAVNIWSSHRQSIARSRQPKPSNV